MKKILNHRLYLPLFIATVALFAACRKEVGAPVITSVRMHKASPMDTLMSVGNPNTDTIWSGGTGQYVAIIGQNLQNALSIKFNGVPASFNNALFAANSAVVPVPTILFSTIDTTKLYTLEYTTTRGTTTFSFKLGPGAPVITAVSDVFANPGDSVFLYGSNLVLVQSLSYAGNPITSFKSNLDGTSLGFKMPAQQPTDRVLLTTKGGSVDYKIVATPTITGVSNENATAGDSVYVYGTYLKNIQSFDFGGVAITSFQSSANGRSVGFKMPSISTSAPVSISTQFGTATTVHNVNTRINNNGVLANVEWGDYFGWNWDGAGPTLAVNDAANNGGWITVKKDFDGVLGSNSTMFLFMDKASMDPGVGNSGGWGNQYQFYMGDNQWVPVANLSDPVDNYAIKFETSVAKPWNGATLCLVSGFAGSSYIARYEPWQISASAAAAYSTKGWQTVTIPLSSFRAKDATLGEGKGASVSSLANLIGATGKTSLMMYLHNYGTGPTATGFYGSFDNVRVVKIK